MVALAATAFFGYAALWPAAGFWPLLTLNLVAGVAQSALMPLGDSLTLAAVRNQRLDYGRVRVWGSLSFIVAAMASGWALAIAPPAALGGNEVLLLVLLASAALFLACLAIPPSGMPRGGRSRRAALAGFAGD